MNCIFTKTWKALFHFFIYIAFFLPLQGSAQHIFHIQGMVKDSTSFAAVSGVAISVKGQSSGTQSAADGTFFLVLAEPRQKEIRLMVQSTGYKKKEVVVGEGNSTLLIYLIRDTLQTPEVTVSDSRIPQNILESPVTISKLEANDIKVLPQENFYAGLITVKGVDMCTNSLFYQNINMRGPANPMSETVLQLTDGMDNTPPGQGSSSGNLNGQNDIDIESITVIPGSASAIYGANAFSGLLDIHSKNPFEYRGLSVQVKNGLTYIDGRYHVPAWFSDYQLRYAKVWREKWAVKVSAGYQQGTDWLNTDTTDFDVTTPVAERGSTNPGRDIFNVYGDENRENLVLGPDSEAVGVSRTGYQSHDMLGTHTDNLRLYASLHYKPDSASEISYMYGYTLYNTCVYPYAWNFRDFRVVYHKLEWKSSHWFVRLYSLHDHDGSSYDARNAANYILEKWKSDSAWFSDYALAYNGQVAGVTSGNHELARKFANTGMPQPGSDEFNRLLAEARDIPINPEGGTTFEDRSSLQHLHAQYDFSSLFSSVKLVAGLEGRLRTLRSYGTMFMDDPLSDGIRTKSLGLYAQGEKRVLHDRLNLLVSARYDKYDAFAGTFTPRVAAVYSFNSRNFLRLSYQTGTRTPDPFDMYREEHNGQYHYVGGLEATDDKFQIHKRGFELQSFLDYITAAHTYIADWGEDSTDAAIQLYKGLLKPIDIDYVHSERVQTAEIGYQCLLFGKALHVDADVFGSIYKDLIAYQWVVLAKEGNPYTPDSLTAAAAAMIEGGGLGRTDGFNTPVNNRDAVYFGGVEASLDYLFRGGYSLSGNLVIYEMSGLDPALDSWLSGVPPFKTNVTISNPQLCHNLGFSINWHWSDATTPRYWKFIDSSIPNNYVHAYSNIDAQVTLRLPEMFSYIKIGASNLLNHYYQNIPYGAAIGGVFYVSIVYEGK